MNPEHLIISAAIILLATGALTALALIANRLMPEAWVSERHDLAVAIVFLVPLIFLLTCLPGSPLAPAAETATQAPAQAIASDPDRGIIPVPLSELNASTANPRPATAIPDSPFQAVALPTWLPVILLTLWAAIAALRLVILARDLKAVSTLISRATPVGIPGGFPLSSPIAMATTPDVISPMLAGYLRPVVLLPEGFRFDDKAAPVLEHEIAHADRHDNWVALGQRVVMALFWWNAPLYALTPMIHGNREKLCDGRAVQITGAAQALAHALLDVATRQVRQPALPLAVAGHRSALASRIKRLARPEGLSRKRPIVTLAVMFPFLAVSAFLLTPRLGEASPDDVQVQDARAEAVYNAAYHGNGQALEDLLASGADLDTPSPGDGTALMGAVRGGHIDIVETLLQRGADPDVTSPGDGTALIAAARRGDTLMVKTLLEAGADPNLGVERDGTPLIAAVQHGRRDIVRRLIKAGADPNHAQPRDGSPLIAAAQHGDKETAHILLEAGADPNLYVYRDETPLIKAAQKGHLDMAKLLVSKGADLSLTVKTGADDPGGPYRSPLSEAKRNDQAQVFDWLKSQGAKHSPPED